MDTCLVPFPESLPPARVVDPKFFVERFSQNRNQLLSDLSCIPGLPMLASNLKNDSLYRVILSPGVGQLKKGPSGFFQAVVRNFDGTIVEHAKLEKVFMSAGLAESLFTVGVQIQLAVISAQLSDIQEGIGDIIDYLHDTRISKIKAGVNQFQQALRIRDDEGNKAHLIDNSLGMLNEGVASIIESLNTEIDSVPRPWLVVSLFDRELGNNKAKRRLLMATESHACALYGIQAITECYALMGQSESSKYSLTSLLDQLSATKVEDAARIADRLMPGHNSWQNYIDRAPLVVQEAENISQKGQLSLEYELEFKPDEFSA